MTNSYHYGTEFHSNKELLTVLCFSCTRLTVNLPTRRASLKFFSSTKRKREFFFCCLLRQSGKEKRRTLRKYSLTSVQKSCFSSRDAQKKVQLYWYMLLKRLNLNTVFNQISAAALIQSKSKDVNSVRN